MCWIERWLEEEPTITDLVVTPTNYNWTQVLNRDPMRFVVLFAWGNGGLLYFHWGDTAPPGTPYGSTWTGGNGNYALHRSRWGEIITRPLWIGANGTGPVNYITTLSYNAQRKSLYDRYCYEQLSRVETAVASVMPPTQSNRPKSFGMAMGHLGH
jgi:hypothetical protein